MGQDLSCMVCSKYYKNCKHYRKEHLPDYDGNAVCGKKDVCILDNDWSDRDIDPNDICKICAKNENLFQSKYILENGEYRLKDDYEQFIVIY